MASAFALFGNPKKGGLVFVTTSVGFLREIKWFDGLLAAAITVFRLDRLWETFLGLPRIHLQWDYGRAGTIGAWFNLLCSSHRALQRKGKTRQIDAG